MKVLIIDDEVDICVVLCNILKKHQIETAYVTRIADAKATLRSFSPTIVFLDNHLPDGRGINFIKEIKQAHPNTYIIMISAYDNLEDRNLAIQNGADLFLSKPFSTKEIVFTLTKIQRSGNAQTGKNNSQ